MNAVALAMLLQVAADNPTRVEQLPSAHNAEPALRLPRSPDKAGQAATITQLPTNLEPLASAKEETLAEAPPTSASNRAAAEIARAVGVIRGRGQQVTPELLAREVGPDVLDVYLAQSNGPVPTGVPNPAAPRELPPGTVIIPSGGQK